MSEETPIDQLSRGLLSMHASSEFHRRSTDWPLPPAGEEDKKGIEFKPTNPKDIIGSKKSPLSCVPLPVLMEIGLGMLEGTMKYGRHNYREAGVRGSIYFDAVIRHLFAWWEGEDIDPDSGISHVVKAMSALVVLRDGMRRGNWIDDRPPKSESFFAELNEVAERIIKRYSHLSPHHYTQKEIDDAALPVHDGSAGPNSPATQG